MITAYLLVNSIMIIIMMSGYVLDIETDYETQIQRF
jgi:hypothetical protein